MSEVAAPRTRVPLEIRPSLSFGLSGPAWGALIAALLMAGALVFRAIMLRLGTPFEAMPIDIGFATRVAIVASASVGYTLAIWRWVGAATARDFDALGLLPTAEETDVYEIFAIAKDRLHRSRLAGLAGVAFFVSTIEVPNFIAGGRFGDAWTSLHPLTYMLFLGVLFFWICGRAAYFMIGRSFFREMLDQLEVDLLDRSALQIFGRIGLRNAFIWVVGISIGMLAFANPELRIAESLIVLVPVLLVTFMIAVAALMLPMRGLHERIVAAKREELARVENAIRGDATALAGSRIADRDPPPSLADLIAYKGLVESAPEWPFDGGTLRRFGLYLLIPLASWVGGALVERAVSVVLD